MGSRFAVIASRMSGLWRNNERKEEGQLPPLLRASIRSGGTGQGANKTTCRLLEQNCNAQMLNRTPETSAPFAPFFPYLSMLAEHPVKSRCSRYFFFGGQMGHPDFPDIKFAGRMGQNSVYILYIQMSNLKGKD